MRQGEDRAHTAHGSGTFVTEVTSGPAASALAGAGPRYTASTITDPVLDGLYAKLHELQQKTAPPAASALADVGSRYTASTITDPVLDGLYAKLHKLLYRAQDSSGGPHEQPVAMTEVRKLLTGVLDLPQEAVTPLESSRRLGLTQGEEPSAI
ncbi:hypothetical protein ACGRHY_27990 [Streptomyces sp. HK10]|uniref:hypothetical protein n=1 Tax=Streptomyces sp. HK10 TaxID=3373255 RepID=UPI00374A7F7B